MAKNDLKLFAGGSSANVMTQAEYEAFVSLINGFSTGVAQSKQLNKVWRQASFVAAMIGLFTGKNSNEDVLDDGDVDSFEAKFSRAMQAFIAAQTAIGSFWQPVISMTITAPPTTPAFGDSYVIPTGATGVWAGKSQSIAVWMGSEWRIFSAKNGHGISLPDGRIFERVGGSYIEKPALDVQSGKWNYAAATGSANALVVNLDPVPQSTPTGMKIRVLVATTNTGAATIAVNGAAAVAIRYADGSDLFPGELVAGRTVDLIRQPNGIWAVLTPTEGFLRLTTKGARDSQINVPLASDIGTSATICAQVTITGATYIEATGAGSIVNIGGTLGDTVLYMDIFDVAANATIITGPQAAASSVNNEKAAVYNRVIGRGFDKTKTYRVRVLASKASNFGQVNIANVNIFAMHD
ncbi:DUF2793 domain-containing protein [Ochrobactrum sp. S1502_03]|uniref:DUF2793 domain-containing protein n=1 Tax=Ochrobactrum sp. S1502_03 TaxID=3108451 RepID=UPI0037CC4527